MLNAHPPPNPRGSSFQSRPQIKNLTTSSKNLYILFNIFELQMSRLTKIVQFQNLINEISMFNDELTKWKKDQHQITNIVLTYHLYQNLFSRLKYISNFCRNEEDAINATTQATRWFQTQKPKVRCQVKETKASMKSYTPDKKESENIQNMVQTSALKREMLPYQMMSRTAHPGIFPPKQELKNYKRKQFLPFGQTEPAQNFMTAKKSTSASLLQRSKLSKFRASMTTMMGTTSTSNFKQTKNSFKNVEQFKLDEVKEDQNKETKPLQQGVEKEGAQNLNEQQLDELERQKKVNNDEAMQQNLVQPVNEEDQPDEDQIYDEQQEEDSRGMKIYIRDHDKIDLQIAEEEAKEAIHSSMRRVMKVNEDKIRSKMEQLDLKRNMLSWGKAKGKNNREESRKLETLLHLNKYKNLQFQRKSENHLEVLEDKKIFAATTGFKDYKSSKDPVIVPMLFRSKSSHPISLESDIQKLRIRETMRTYGRYINNHIASQVDTSPVEVDKKQTRTQSTDFRSMSLTSFAQRGKKKNFSNVIGSQNPQSYNQSAQNDLMRIKTSLSGKSLPVEKGIIYKALSIVPKQQTLVSNGMYTAGRDLLSNPFFPKHLYGPKKKKKKSKK